MDKWLKIRHRNMFLFQGCATIFDSCTRTDLQWPQDFEKAAILLLYSHSSITPLDKTPFVETQSKTFSPIGYSLSVESVWWLQAAGCSPRWQHKSAEWGWQGKQYDLLNKSAWFDITPWKALRCPTLCSACSWLLAPSGFLTSKTNFDTCECVLDVETESQWHTNMTCTSQHLSSGCVVVV